MPITEILKKNAELYPDDVALTEINPQLEEEKHTTWKEYALIEAKKGEAYKKEITWKEFDKKELEKLEKETTKIWEKIKEKI